MLHGALKPSSVRLFAMLPDVASVLLVNTVAEHHYTKLNYLGGRNGAAKKNVIFLAVVFKSQGNIFSFRMMRTAKEFAHFLGDFARPLRKLSISLAFLLGSQGNDMFS